MRRASVAVRCCVRDDCSVVRSFRLHATQQLNSIRRVASHLPSRSHTAGADQTARWLPTPVAGKSGKKIATPEKQLLRHVERLLRNRDVAYAVLVLRAGLSGFVPVPPIHAEGAESKKHHYRRQQEQMFKPTPEHEPEHHTDGYTNLAKHRGITTVDTAVHETAATRTKLTSSANESCRAPCATNDIANMKIASADGTSDFSDASMWSPTGHAIIQWQAIAAVLHACLEQSQARLGISVVRAVRQVVPDDAWSDENVLTMVLRLQCALHDRAAAAQLFSFLLQRGLLRRRSASAFVQLCCAGVTSVMTACESAVPLEDSGMPARDDCGSYDMCSDSNSQTHTKQDIPLVLATNNTTDTAVPAAGETSSLYSDAASSSPNGTGDCAGSCTISPCVQNSFTLGWQAYEECMRLGLSLSMKDYIALGRACAAVRAPVTYLHRMLHDMREHIVHDLPRLFVYEILQPWCAYHRHVLQLTCDIDCTKHPSLVMRQGFRDGAMDANDRTLASVPEPGTTTTQNMCDAERSESGEEHCSSHTRFGQGLVYASRAVHCSACRGVLQGYTFTRAHRTQLLHDLLHVILPQRCHSKRARVGFATWQRYLEARLNTHEQYEAPPRCFGASASRTRGCADILQGQPRGQARARYASPDVLIDGANVGYHGLSRWYSHAKRALLERRGVRAFSITQAEVDFKANQRRWRTERCGVDVGVNFGLVDCALRTVMRVHHRRQPLIVLHERHCSAQNMSYAGDADILQRWREHGWVYCTPAGLDDDLCWLYGALMLTVPSDARTMTAELHNANCAKTHQAQQGQRQAVAQAQCAGQDRCNQAEDDKKCQHDGNDAEDHRGGVCVLTNDCMRDHHFRLLSPRSFARWRANHQMTFTYRDPACLRPAESAMLGSATGADEHEMTASTGLLLCHPPAAITRCIQQPWPDCWHIPYREDACNDTSMHDNKSESDRLSDDGASYADTADGVSTVNDNELSQRWACISTRTCHA